MVISELCVCPQIDDLGILADIALHPASSENAMKNPLPLCGLESLNYHDKRHFSVEVCGA